MQLTMTNKRIQYFVDKMVTDECKLILILLGPSGSGKTSFGKKSALGSGDKIMFLSTGDELRKKEILSPWQEPDIQTVKVICQEMINKTLEEFKVSKTHRVLILDCVKDLGDAEYTTLQAKKYGFEITRALLMNVNPGELESRWKQRGEPRDSLRLGSAISYFHSWRKKSNDVFNYYKKMNVLSLNASDESLDDCFLDKDIIMSDYPVVPCSNSVYFQLLDAVKVRNVLEFLLSLLDINRFDFALPASFVHNDDDVTWVANPTRYHVTVKSDGVRFLLVKINEESFLINRKREIYPCQLESNDLPNNTVLDGELLPSTTFSEIHPKTTTSLKTNVFLSFDVLAAAGEILWKWPFSERRVALSQLPISKDVGAVMQEASSDGLATPEKKSQAALKELGYGTEKLAVKVTIKEHFKSTADAIFSCLSSSKNVPYPCDGLVFTPDTPYTFGPDPLLFKWQPEILIHCDISCIELENGKRRSVSNSALRRFLSSGEEGSSGSRLFGGIMECHWNNKMSAWEPLFLRHDKPAPNSDDTIDWLEKICQDPYPESRLVTHLTRIIDDDDKVKKDEKAGSPLNKRYPLIHPTMSYSFDELYSLVDQLVQLNEVEKVTESTTSLEIFNYYISSSPSNPNVQLCRGLVLHPESKTVVTKPFVRFFEDVNEPADPSEIVEATVKFDGSLGIAFQWNNEVKVTTRRRMDSEQAIWAKQWIQDHCDASIFQTGFTYLFEIVYKVNTVIVEYHFQGLVLLAVADGNGHELPYNEVMRFGKAAGFFMVTPRITGSYSEIAWYCGGIHPSEGSTQPTRSSSSSGILPKCSRQQEGWVVKFNDGRRQKIIYKWWKHVSKVTHLVHPQIVWLLVRHNQIENVFRNIPSHFRREIQCMMKAIARLFYQTLELIRQSIPSSHSKKKKSKTFKRWPSNAFICMLNSGSSELESEESEQASDEEPFNLRELFTSLDEVDVNESKLCEKKSNDSDEITRKRSTLENNDFQQSNISDKEEEGGLQRLLTQAKPYRRKIRNKMLEYFSPFYKQYGSNDLRLAILDHIRITKPAIDGYEPSDNFQQTMSKGWKILPNDQRKLIQEVLQENHQYPPLLQMPNEIILLVLEFLDGQSLEAMRMVCWRLYEIVQSRQSLKDKIEAALSWQLDYSSYSCSPDYSYYSCSYGSY